MIPSEALLAAQVAVYILAAITLGHTCHELLHVVAALLVGCDDVAVGWVSVLVAGGPLQRTTVAVTPLLVGSLATVLWVLNGVYWIAAPSWMNILLILFLLVVGYYSFNPSSIFVWISAFVLLGYYLLTGSDPIIGVSLFPHPAWFGLAALTVSGRDDVGMVWQSGRDLWTLARLAREWQ